MAIEGVDYSTSRPRPWVLWQDGKRFAGRYIGPGSSGKHLTYSEAKTLAGAGLSIVSIAEGYGDDALKGRTKGREHAALAVDAAQDVNMPEGRPIYFAVDFDATASQLSTVAAYLEGCADRIGPFQVGVYGGIRTVDYAATHGVADWFWQTYAWSYGKVSARAHGLQYRNHQVADGALVDLDRALKGDYGGWVPYTGSFGSAPPPPPPGTVETPFDWSSTVDITSPYFDAAAAAVEGATSALQKGF